MAPDCICAVLWLAMASKSAASDVTSSLARHTAALTRPCVHAQEGMMRE